MIKESNQIKVASYETSKKLTKALEELNEYKFNNENMSKRLDNYKATLTSKEAECKSLLLRNSLYATQNKGESNNPDVYEIDIAMN
jgi:hypothetical protein